MLFSELSLSEPILRAVAEEGYTAATPVQAQTIPHALAGRDVLGCAQTGTGKTAAFSLPLLHRLSVDHAGRSKLPRVLVLCPTRELAIQIGDSFRVYGRHVHLKTTAVFGGVGIGPQASVLRRGVDILIATPGRLMDLVNQRLCDLSGVEVLVLDEADRMLDMGFIHDIRKIIAMLPGRKQSMMFSATMAPEILKLSHTILTHPATVRIAPEAPVADRIQQSVYHVNREDKVELLARLVKEMQMTRAIVFTRTKHGADRLVRKLYRFGVRSEAIHGNKTQNNRKRALDNLRDGKTQLLIATDVASRGIDIDGITHVVNYDLTDTPDTYIHRIGRTARAGAAGAAISFCDSEERANLRAIERHVGRAIPVKTATGARLAPKHEEPSDRSERSEHAERAHRSDRHERSAHADRHERTDRPHRREDRSASGHRHSGPAQRGGHHAAQHRSSHGPTHASAHTSAHSAPHAAKPHVKRESAAAPAPSKDRNKHPLSHGPKHGGKPKHAGRRLMMAGE